MKLLLLTAVVSALMMSMSAAQDNTYAGCLMNGATFFPVSGLSSNSFCTFNSNGTFARCNSTRVNITAPVTCTTTYKREEVFKRPTTFTHNREIVITKLERETVPITNFPKDSDGWYTLRRGQTVKVTFVNSGDKSAFVDLVY